MNQLYLSRFSMSLLAVLAMSAVLHATPRLPGFFTDSMVLQRDKPVPIWGWAEPGETVTISFANQKVSAITSKFGKWTGNLKAMPASAESRELSVNSDKTETPLVLKDILVGDVWICSGQSNMEWTVDRSANSSVEMVAAKFPLIRHLKIPHVATGSAKDDVKGIWTVCSAKTVANFTAVGYFFGRKLHQELNVPIGLIGTNWGGTRVEPWAAPEGLRMVPELKDISKMVEESLPTSEAGKLAHLKVIEETRLWLNKAEEAIKNEQPLSNRPVWPGLNEKRANRNPTYLYNGMIHPLIPYAIRGAIWYQGESNGVEGISYFHKKRALIEGWRKLWNQGDFPFYFVQLANFKTSPNTPEGGDGWSKLREAQRQTLTIPNTGMAVIIELADTKNYNNIHPKNKQDVGLRLAQWALAKEYGKDIVASGPLYKNLKVEGEKIRISFEYVGKGLMIGKKEGLTPTVEVTEGKLKHFAIAGDDKKWVWAEAVIDGDDVVVSNPDVKAPIAVRYGYRMNPVGANLYNKDGLPASPFRTDTW